MRASLSDFPQRLPANTCAVYALCWQQEVVYVGKSTAVHNRVAKHRNNYLRWLKGKPRYHILDHSADVIQFDEVCVRYCKQYEMDDLEFAMIQKYKPDFNIQHMRAHPIEVEVRAGKLDVNLEGLGLWESKNSSSNFVRRV